MKNLIPVAIMMGIFLIIPSMPEGSSEDGVRVEILSIEAIPNGIAVFARVWENGEQIGFGQNGTVDIERFRFVNAEFTDRADLLSTLEHTIAAKTQKFGDDNIISDTVGSTTTTVFPDGGSTTEDGRMQQTDTDWATARNATTSGVNNDDDPQDTCGQTDFFLGTYTIERFGLTFPSPGIGTDTIDSVVVSLFGTSKVNDDNDGNDYIVAVSFAPASNTAFVSGDYDAFGTTDLSGQIDIGDISTSAYNDFTLNATGRDALNKNAINAIGFIEGHDDQNDPPDNGNEFLCNSSEASGTSTDPKMVIEHTAAAGGAAPTSVIFFG